MRINAIKELPLKHVCLLLPLWEYRFREDIPMHANRPVLIDGLNEVSYSIQSPYGKVSSTIHNNAREAVIDLIVPVGASATVTLPVTHEQKTVSQGHYHFQVRK